MNDKEKIFDVNRLRKIRKIKNIKACERCGKKYERSEDEIVVYPNLCKECDIILSKGKMLGNQE